MSDHEGTVLAPFAENVEQLSRLARASRRKVLICGAQSGCEQIAVRRARDTGTEAHVVLPKGLRTKSGPTTRQQLKEMGATYVHELLGANYLTRAWMTVAVSDATLVLANAQYPGVVETLRACHAYHKPHIISRCHDRDSDALRWVLSQPIRVLNVVAYQPIEDVRGPHGCGAMFESLLSAWNCV